MKTPIKEPESFYIVRFQDCDLMGHLNNARFIDYILNAREDHLAEHYNISLLDYMQKGLGWLVAGHEIYYRKPAMYNEKILIQTSLIQYSESDLMVEGIVMDAAKTHLKALLWTRYVFINTRTGKRDAHPAHLLEFFASVLNGDPALSGAKERLQQLTEVMKSR